MDHIHSGRPLSISPALDAGFVRCRSLDGNNQFYFHLPSFLVYISFALRTSTSVAYPMFGFLLLRGIGARLFHLHFCLMIATTIL